MLKEKSRNTLLVGVSLLLFWELLAAGFQLLSPDTKIRLYRRYTSPLYSVYAKYSEFFLYQKMPIYYISKKNLDHKLEHPAAWMQKQIDSDFVGHNQDVSTENVMHTYDTFPTEDRVVLFQIKEGKLKVSKRKETMIEGSNEHALKIYTHIFEYLAQKGYVHNLSFLFMFSYAADHASEQQVAKAAPILAMVKNLTKVKEQGFILVPDYMNLDDIPNKMAARVLFANTVFPWQTKENKMLWRGGYEDVSGFRAKVVAFSQQHPESMVDAKFAAEKKDFILPEKQLKAKYLLSIDGASATWTRLVWQLLSNSVVLKQDSPIIQWYYAALQPGVHYVPFSSANPEALESRVKAYTDAELQAIAEHGSDFAKNNLMFDDMIAYMVKVLQTYEGLQTKADR